MSGHAGTTLAEPWKNRNADYAGMSVANKNRMMQGIIQEAVEAAEREAIQVGRATENTNQTGLIGKPMYFSKSRPKEKEIFDDYMEAKANRELALIRKQCHAKWKEAQELALLEELRDGVMLEGWGKQFFPTPCDQL